VTTHSEVADPATNTRSLAGRRILVSGGTSGLGAATVHAAIAAGARVGVLGRRAELLQRLAAGTGAEVAPCDVTDAEATDAAVAALAERLGGLDGLVNCAGQMLHSRLTDGFRQDWTGMLSVNVVGTMNATLAALPFLRATACADLMFISSPSADRVAGAEFAMYAATKAALSRLTEAIRAELEGEGSSIRLTVVKPGYIDTDGVVASIRDPAARALIAGRAKSIGLPPAYFADQIVHLLGLPPEVRVTEISLGRSPGSELPV
jgi:NADP-dependent 3-hydroxy acid dehydrogenase YdfG